MSTGRIKGVTPGCFFFFFFLMLSKDECIEEFTKILHIIRERHRLRKKPEKSIKFHIRLIFSPKTIRKEQTLKKEENLFSNLPYCKHHTVYNQKKRRKPTQNIKRNRKRWHIQINKINQHKSTIIHRMQTQRNY